MDKDTTLRLAREAGAHWEYSRSHPVPCVFGDDESLMRFAALVAEHLKSEGYRQCAKGQRTTQFCGMVEQAVRDEREECARMLERRVTGILREVDAETKACAAAIRSRT